MGWLDKYEKAQKGKKLKRSSAEETRSVSSDRLQPLEYNFPTTEYVEQVQKNKKQALLDSIPTITQDNRTPEQRKEAYKRAEEVNNSSLPFLKRPLVYLNNPLKLPGDLLDGFIDDNPTLTKNPFPTSKEDAIISKLNETDPYKSQNQKVLSTIKEGLDLTPEAVLNLSGETVLLNKLGPFLKNSARFTNAVGKATLETVKDITAHHTYPVIYKKQIKAVKDAFEEQKALIKSPEGKQRLREMGINPQGYLNKLDNIDLTFNSRGSYYNPTFSRINIDPGDVNRMKDIYKTDSSIKDILNHEIGHSMQHLGFRTMNNSQFDSYLKDILRNDFSNMSKLNQTPIDEKLLGLDFIPKNKLGASSKKDLDYMIFGNQSTLNPNSLERLAFIREMRSALLEKKYIKNQYDKVTPELIDKFYKENPKNRVVRLTENTLNNNKLLSDVFNSLATATGVSIVLSEENNNNNNNKDSAQQFKNGGWLDKYQDGGNIPKRIGVRKNLDGSESTHLMRAEKLNDSTWVGFPTLFQNPDGVWVDMSKEAEKDWMPVYQEALRRNEVRNFGRDSISALKYGEGSWKLKKLQDGGVIEDDRGQWAHPGKITKINSNNITMEGVNYPVFGVSDTGDAKLMMPNQNYKFKGNSVTEYPIKAQKGKTITVDSEDDPRYQAYQDSLTLYNVEERIKKNILLNNNNLDDNSIINAFMRLGKLNNKYPEPIGYTEPVYIGRDNLGKDTYQKAELYKKPEQEVIVKSRPKEKGLTLPETSGLQVTEQSPEFDGQMRIPMNRGWDVVESVQPGLGGYTSKYKTFDKDRIDYLQRKAEVDRNRSTGRMNFIQILPDYNMEGFNPNGIEGVDYQVLNPGGNEQKTKRQIREEKAAALKTKQKGKNGLSLKNKNNLHNFTQPTTGGWLDKYN